MKIISTLTLSVLALPLIADTGITIYNQNIAVVRETLPIKLGNGVSSVLFDRATAQVRPDSVVLRDPNGKVPFSILEQSYRNDPVSEGLLLQYFEGKEIPFKTTTADGRETMTTGTIIRSGYGQGRNQSPIVKIDGSLQFGLPGQPIFPALGDNSILRPTLSWQIEAPAAADFNAQLSYLTGGFNWQATYNIVAPEKGETVTLNGWVTLTNRSGSNFQDGRIKLVAGDVNVVQPQNDGRAMEVMMRMKSDDPFGGGTPRVEEKAFDDFHLYTLPRQINLRDQETKQVEFLRSEKLQAEKVYIYAPVGLRYRGSWNNGNDGSQWPKDVSTYWEFENNKENGLGVPLPGGVVRFYRSDNADGNLEFVGENTIEHTPNNEQVRVKTGTAFDLVGERTITSFEASNKKETVRETFKITVKNRSKEEKTIIVREPLWRWHNWKIETPSMDFKKVDAHTIEFSVTLQPDSTQDLSYTAFYSAEPTK